MSMTRDLLQREITLDTEDFTVSRTRSSNGLSSITVFIKASKTQIAITSEGYGRLYELVARKLADAIYEVVNHGCELPRAPKEGK